jgi:hypothetical protein
MKKELEETHNTKAEEIPKEEMAKCYTPFSLHPEKRRIWS